MESIAAASCSDICRLAPADRQADQSDAALARLASRALGCAVACDPGPEYPEVHPLAPVFLEVSADGERLFVPDA